MPFWKMTGKLFGNRTIMSLLTRNKTGTGRDKTGTDRYETGKAGTKQEQQEQDRKTKVQNGDINAQSKD